MRTCCLSWPFVLKPLEAQRQPAHPHLKGRSPVCVRVCKTSACLALLEYTHCEHLNFLVVSTRLFGAFCFCCLSWLSLLADSTSFDVSASDCFSCRLSLCLRLRFLAGAGARSPGSEILPSGSACLRFRFLLLPQHIQTQHTRPGQHSHLYLHS